MPKKRTKKKELTEKQKEQKRLRKEAQALRQKALRRVRDISKRGYSVSKKLVKDLPKTVSPATLEYYRSITPQYVYSKSVYVGPTGKVITGEERRAQERSEVSKKAAETRRLNFYDNYSYEYSQEPASEMAQIMESLQALEELEQFFYEWEKSSDWSKELADYKESDKNKAKSILEGARARLGDDVVANNAKINAVRLNELAMQLLYESGNKYRYDSRNNVINQALVEFRNLLYGEAATISESKELNEFGLDGEDYEQS